MYPYQARVPVGVTGCVPVTNLSLFGSKGTARPNGQLSKDRKGRNISNQRETVNTTHLALSGPGGAPVTTDEPCLLGRKRIRALCIPDGERERALDNMILERLDKGGEAEPEETCKEENETGTEVTCHREHSLERGNEDKEKCSEAASCRNRRKPEYLQAYSA